jgi:hypothetical protein
MRFGSEDRLQQSICQLLRWRGVKGLVFFSVPNGAARNPIEAHIKKSTGMRAGVSDLILLHAGKVYALELKTLKGRTTNSQIEFLTDWGAAGGEGWICHGFEETKAKLEEWGLLRSASHERASVLPLSA